MSDTTCGRCANWELRGLLGEMGHGACLAETNPMLRAGRTTSAHCACRIGKFRPAARNQCRTERFSLADPPAPNSRSQAQEPQP